MHFFRVFRNFVTAILIDTKPIHLPLIIPVRYSNAIEEIEDCTVAYDSNETDFFRRREKFWYRCRLRWLFGEVKLRLRKPFHFWAG